jgi:hypothetical protein
LIIAKWRKANEKSWTVEKLYKLFDLTDEEIAIIESTIREMEGNNADK